MHYLNKTNAWALPIDIGLENSLTEGLVETAQIFKCATKAENHFAIVPSFLGWTRLEYLQFVLFRVLMWK